MADGSRILRGLREALAYARGDSDMVNNSRPEVGTSIQALPAKTVRELDFAGDNLGNLDGLFNTFRIGGQWSGWTGEVELHVTNAGGIRSLLPGKAIVLRSVEGTLQEMLEAHAGLNHAKLDGSRWLNRRIQLRRTLVQSYGKTGLADNTHCVVLYVWRTCQVGH